MLKSPNRIKGCAEPFLHLLSCFKISDTMAAPSIWDLPEVDEDLLNRDLAAAERYSAESGADADMSDADDCDQAEDEHPNGEQPGGEQPGDEQPGDEQPGDEQPYGEQPVEFETSAHTVWGRIRAGNPPTFKEVKDILEKIPEKVTMACIDGTGYSGQRKHEDIMVQLLGMQDVHGIVRVMRKAKGDHTLWCFFKADGSSRVLRSGKPEGFLEIEGSIFDAMPRGKNHPAGYMSTHCFLSCAELGKGRPNFVDFVESML